MKIIKDYRIDYELLFTQQYRSLQAIYTQCVNEQDVFVKKSLLKLLLVKCDELITCINNGAEEDREEILLQRKKFSKELRELDHEDI